MRTQMQKKDAAKAAHLRRLDPAKRDSFPVKRLVCKKKGAFL